MGKPTVASNRTRIEVNTANIENLKEDVGEVKLRVTNHIPTAIRKLDNKVDGMSGRLTKVEANQAWLKWIGVTSAGSLIVGVINMMLRV